MTKKKAARTVHLLCNAHLDPVWLWQWEEGAAEAISTFRTAAELCEKDKGFIFNHNEAILYEWVQEYEPALFKRIQKLVKQGKWHIMGGWYLQPDCNMPSGEGFVRQIQLGREYFAKHFGVRPTTAINFDPFGHSRGLVQIMAKSGYDSYVFGRPTTVDIDLPSEDFVWVGMDGSEVTASRFRGWYNTHLGRAVKIIQERLEAMPKDEPAMILWGVGNHGGGPSKKDLRDVNDMIRQNESDCIRHSTPEAYFKELQRSQTLRRYRKDINPWATGCYTSQVRIKQAYRRLENELLLTEKMATAAWTQKVMVYPTEEFRTAQRDLMMGQFHDILPGSSIPTVEDDAVRLMEHGQEIVSRVKARAFFALSRGQKRARDGEIPILVYNPHPFAIKQVVECEFHLADHGARGSFTDIQVTANGKNLPTQVEKELSNIPLDWRKRVAFAAVLEPGRMNRFDCRVMPNQKRPKPALKKRGQHYIFKTKEVEVLINTRTGWVDRYRVGGADMVGKGAFQPVVMLDNADPWGMLHRRYDRRVGSFKLLSHALAARFAGGIEKTLSPVRVIEDGAVRTVVEVLSGYGDSMVCQRYKLPKHGTEIEIEVVVYWQEKDRMLKLNIPACQPFSRYLGQTAYGVHELPVNGDESVAQKWTAAVDNKRSMALTCINQATYGSDCDANGMRMTLLRSAAYSCHPIDGDMGLAKDRYVPRIDQGRRSFRFWLNGGSVQQRLSSIDREALAHNEQPFALSFFPPGDGNAMPKPAVELNDKVVQVTALKKAERSNDVIVRLFEPTGRKRKTVLRLPMLGIRKSIELGSHEVKTYRINSKTKQIREVDLMEK